MHSALYLLTLVALQSFADATPMPQATGSALRKKVLVQELPKRRSMQKRGADGKIYFDEDFAFQEFDRLDSKYSYHNSVYQKNQNSTNLRKRGSGLVEVRGIQEQPYDLAAHRKRHGKRAGVASVSLTDDVEVGVDVSYYSQNLNIGTPAQTFSIDFDTGSADLWVLGANVQSSSSTGSGSPFGAGRGESTSASDSGHATFTPSSSSTNTLSSKAFDITYGTGEIDGTVTQDVVELNGLSVQDQTFGIATTVSNDFINSPFDGLMGIGFSTISQTDGNTWTENLVIEKSLASNLFSVQLERGSATLANSYSSGQVLNDQSGMIIFGAIDSSTYTGDIVYAPVNVEAYWETTIDGAALNGQIIGNTSFNAAIDTGTSLVYVPTTVAANIASAIGAQAYRQTSSSVYYAMDCDAFEDLNLAFSFGGTLFQFNGADLNGGRISSSADVCMFAIIGANTNDPLGKPLAIVGDAFLKSVVAVFDYSNDVRVGLAAQVGANSTASPIAGNSRISSANTFSLSSVLLLPVLLFLALH